MFIFAKEKEEKKYEILNKLNHNSEILWIIQCDEDEKMCVIIKTPTISYVLFFTISSQKGKNWNLLSWNSSLSARICSAFILRRHFSHSLPLYLSLQISYPSFKCYFIRVFIYFFSAIEKYSIRFYFPIYKSLAYSLVLVFI